MHIFRPGLNLQAYLIIDYTIDPVSAEASNYCNDFISRTALPMTLNLDLLATKDPNLEEDKENQETPIYEKFDNLLHGGNYRKK